MSISELKHMSEPVRRIELFTGVGRRRSWTAGDKASIVAESLEPGASVCAVARRHGLTPQQLFTWRRDARERAKADGPAFLPAVLEPESAGPKSKPPRARRTRRRGAAIEVDVAGVKVTIENGASAATIAAVIGALKGSS